MDWKRTGNAALAVLTLALVASVSFLLQGCGVPAEVKTEQTQTGSGVSADVSADTGPEQPPDCVYTLFAPLQSKTTYLIDDAGGVVRTWDSDYPPGCSVYLLENGNILRCAALHRGDHPKFTGGGSGGLVEEIAPDGSVVWEYRYAGDDHLSHHDIEPMPNGNVLMIAWEFKTAEEAVAAGCDPSLLRDGVLWPDHIIEVEPAGGGGEIVWEWHVWDHLVQDYDPARPNYGDIASHPELINLNYGAVHGGADMTHVNSVDYNEELDQVLLSVPRFSEIWIIDHGTNTAEAASHSGGRYGRGGDLLYRWGNPKTYRAAGEQLLFSQHDANWIEDGYPGEGNITVFNNGNGRPEGEYSSVEEIEPPVDEEGRYMLDPGSAYGPAEPVWSYSARPPEEMFSWNVSGAQRLPNGNTLVCIGADGRLLEVTAAGENVWEYVNPYGIESPKGLKNNVFKALKYPAEYPGLQAAFPQH